jgi:dihydrofolate synthase/folylpolyglutamate synthase
VRRETLKGSAVDLRFNGSRYKDLKISLPGRFQSQNAALALAAVEEVNGLGQFRLSERSMRTGLGKIQDLTGLQGRLSLWQRKPQVILDVAHNPDGVRHLVAALKHLKIEDLILVFGIMKDKDHLAIVRGVSSLRLNVQPVHF